LRSSHKPPLASQLKPKITWARKACANNIVKIQEPIPIRQIELITEEKWARIPRRR